MLAFVYQGMGMVTTAFDLKVAGLNPADCECSGSLGQVCN